MKKLLLLFGIVCMVMFSVTSFASEGMDISKLSPEEQALYLSLRDKAVKAKNFDIGEFTSSVNPQSLTEWRIFITDTIKETCRDLNITVNEFIKTPAGAGIAFLIIYKIAGKDVLFNVTSKVFDVIFMIPLWFFVCLCLLLITNKFFGCETEYQHEEEIVDEKGKKHIRRSSPKKVIKYPWYSSDARVTLGSFLVGIFIANTFVCIMIIFS